MADYENTSATRGLSDDDEPVARTLNFNFSSILPEAVLLQHWNRPYDRHWVEALGLSQYKLAAFNVLAGTSRWKLVDLSRKGAIRVGDQFEVGVVTAGGQEVYRYLDVVGKVISGKDANCPVIRMPQIFHNDPPSADHTVKGPVDITNMTVRHYGDAKPLFSPHKAGWQNVRLCSNGQVVDSLHDVRQRYALWVEVVDWFTGAKGWKGRRRRVDPWTGEYIQHPALTIRES
ncbi:MAG: hypothetical protein Q9184_005426 [Pyrenodesmia sp. 2 TL-2023]